MKNLSADSLKSFAMTSQLIEADLSRIEREYDVDLGRKRVEASEVEERYLPQFDNSLLREAAEMAEHYQLFYCLEKSIRQVIQETLEASEGANWWESERVPKLVHDEVEKRIKREMDSGITLRSSDPIDYTTFGELGEVIKSNWDLFGSLFNSKRAVEKVMSNLNLLRGPIAHCSPLASDEVLRLELSLRDWYRLME